MLNVRFLGSAFAAVALLFGFAACSDDGDDKKPVQPECSVEADCRDGFVCVAERCVPEEEPEPTCDPACGDDAPICDEGVCVVCTATEGCDDGLICDTGVEGGACVGCLENTDCQEGNGEVCVDGSCVVPVECTDSEQCDEDAPVCADGKCVVCTATEGCGEGFVCNTSVAGGACVTCTAEAGCADGSFCDTAKDACVACLSNAHCDEGEMCSDGACVARPECTTSDECGDDAPVCDDGVCVTCVTTGDCAEGFVCDTGVDGGACVVCVGNGDCAEGEFCTGEQTCAPIVNPSADIQAVRNATSGPVELSIGHAFVTYVRPAVGGDDAGFFVQGDVAGPAIFVAFGDESLDVVAGDEVSFDVTAVATLNGGVRKVATFENLETHTRGNDVSGLAAELSRETDLVSNVAVYESRLITLAGTLVGEVSMAGAGHAAFTLSTEGIPSDSGLKLRMPATLQDTLELEADCLVTFTGPMWRFTDTAQASAYVREDFSRIDCASPRVEKAVATSETEVVVHFTRTIDPASVEANGSQFTFGGELTASAARVEGKTVVVTTDEQTGGHDYIVFVDNTVTDTLGKQVGGLGEAEFVGYAGEVGRAALIINEFNQSTGKAELLVTEGGSLAGIVLRQNLGAQGTSASQQKVLANLPDLVVETGDLIVVHLDKPSGLVTEATSKSESTNAAAFADAWDVVGVQKPNNSSQVIVLVDGDGVPFHAVVFQTGSQEQGGFVNEVLNVVSLGLWSATECEGAACNVAWAKSSAVSWEALTTGQSVQRYLGENGSSKNDWAPKGNHTFGAANISR